ncbi:MAG: Asp/Glu racemase [Gammaproteobacteria bacterium]|nr:Asp/Glu racemase [Gammaproteobacteria bacterium]
MDKREYKLGDFRVEDRRLRRLGMIVPASNTNAEPDCLMLAPTGLTIHFTRSGGYDVDAIPDSDEMRRFARQSLDQQLQLLVDGRVELIAYACTSATLADGPEFDRAFCDEITAKSGLPAVTTAGALVEAIQALECNRVAFTSPYVPRLVDDSVDFIQRCGIEVVNQVSYENELSSLEQNRLTPEDAYRMGLKADHPQAQALVISCTDYRALEAVPALEAALGKPVVTSNSALMYACLKRLGVDYGTIAAGGYLFTRRN